MNEWYESRIKLRAAPTQRTEDYQKRGFQFKGFISAQIDNSKIDSKYHLRGKKARVNLNSGAKLWMHHASTRGNRSIPFPSRKMYTQRSAWLRAEGLQRNALQSK
jgi:hypothetical protein